MESAEALRRHHLALSHKLRDLRIDAGLSGHDLASVTGWSQSRISRLETARQRPTPDEIKTLGKALGVSANTVKELQQDLEALEDEWQSFREMQHGGSHSGQVAVQELEAACRTFRQFERTLVPGLLQTPEYTRALCDLVDKFETDDDIDEVINVRQERQEILNDSSKQFTFVIVDWALTNRYGSADVMAEQYEHIIQESQRKNIRLGLLTKWTPLPFIPHSSFQIFDESLVTVDTSNGQLTLKHQDDVAEHIDQFEKAKKVAVAGSDAREVLKQLLDSVM